MTNYMLSILNNTTIQLAKQFSGIFDKSISVIGVRNIGQKKINNQY